MPDKDLDSLIQDLLHAFKYSRGVNRGGPGGFPVKVEDEIWNVGLSPGEEFFACNGVSGKWVRQFRSFTLTPPSELTKNETARFDGGYWDDPACEEAVTSVTEVQWLIALVSATNTVEWGGAVEVKLLP